MVAFEEHFWGEKHGGYEVLYQNMKQGQSAAKELSDFLRERASSEEAYGKQLHRLAKSSGTVASLGSFQPWWEIVRSSTEKVANIHFQVNQKMLDVIKDLKDYGDALKEKHKSTKDELSSTADIVQTMQTISAALIKAKENYQSRSAELEKAKKDTSKDVEKAEQKAKKATEEYKCLVEKREEVRSQFVIRMKQTCKKFQELESEHLKSMKNYIGKYLASMESGQLMIGQVFNDFKTQLSNLPPDKLIQSFIAEKETGKDIPDVIVFETYEGGSIPSPTEPSVETTNNIPRTHSSSAFLKKRKEKKKKKKKAKNMANGSIDYPSSESGDVPSEGNDATSPTQVDEEGYTIRPPDAESISNKSRSSFSDSESDDDEPLKIHVKINPVENGTAQQASIDELKALTKGLTLHSPATMRRETNGEKRHSGDLQRNQMRGFSSSSDLVDICFSSDSIPSKVASDASLSSRSSSTPTEESKSPLDDLSFLDPLKTTSTDVPPELPVKKVHPVVTANGNSPSESPPPLPVKRATIINKSPNPGNHSPKHVAPITIGAILEERSSVSSNEDLSKGDKSQIIEAGKLPAPIRPPPIGGELPRSNSTGSVALPRPKPGSLQAKTGVGLVPPPLRTSTLPGSSSLPGSSTLLALSATASGAQKDESKPPAPLASEDPFGSSSSTTAFTASFPTPGFANFEGSFSSGFETNFTDTTSTKPAVKDVIPTKSSSHDLRAIFEEALRESEALSSSSGRSTPTSVQEGENPNCSPTSAATASSSVEEIGLVRSSTISGLNIAPPPKGIISTLPRANTTGSLLPQRAMTLPHHSGKKDSIPVAVAFIECVNAVFKGSDLPRCVAKVTGDMTISFPASIIPVLASNPAPPLLTFQMTGMNTIEQVIPNKNLLQGEGTVVEGGALEFTFNMQALSAHLKKQAEQGSASYYNIDILKYQVKLSPSSFQSTPLQLCSFWKCEKPTTDLRVDFKYNGSCLSTMSSLTNVSVIAPVDGGVTVLRSKPAATWSSEQQKAIWKIPEISSTEGPGFLRARFDVQEGPSKPAPLSVQFSCEGATVSRINFELNNNQYRVSLVKKKLSTGKYTVEPLPPATPAQPTMTASNC